jgi:hypothetical protein
MANAAAKKAEAGEHGEDVHVFHRDMHDIVLTEFLLLFLSLSARRATYTKARLEASSSYLPIILAINGIYLFLRLIYQRSLISVSHLVVTIILVILSVVSYKGILDDHANTISKGKGGSGEALAGGASLDLLGLVSIVQYGSVFVSTKIYWLLVLIPLWGGWKLYCIFKGSVGGLFPNGGTTKPTNESAVNDASAEQLNAKKQKRAERRQQKWS